MIDDIVLKTHESLKLNKINDNLYLTNKEIETLMFTIEEILNDSDGSMSDLEEVSSSIAEFNYYHNTNK